MDLFIKSIKFHYKRVHCAKCASVSVGMKPDCYARSELTFFFLVRKVVQRCSCKDDADL